MSTTSPPSSRATVKRLPERGAYDREAIDAIVDANLICHLGFVHEGSPVVIPTICARAGDVVYVHGSVASRMLRTLAGDAQACLTVTSVDGIVVARSAFHHSLNYRSVVVFGQPRLVESDDEKLLAFEAITNHVLPGRWEECRQPNRVELRQTNVLAFTLDEASAKVRVGGPKDEPDDYGLPHWAGVIPLISVAGEPIADDALAAGTPLPASVLALT